MITRAAAQRVLAAYTTTNNQANKLRNDGLLAAIETGSSYQMDAGGYRFLRASDPAGADYAPMELTDPSFYIPRQAASAFPHWFVAEVTYPQNPGNTSGPGYVLFTQASPGASPRCPPTRRPRPCGGSSMMIRAGRRAPCPAVRDAERKNGAADMAATP